MQKLNVKLIRRIQRHITEEPRRFVMSTFGTKVKSQKEWVEWFSMLPDASRTMPPCGTAACIAGTANLLTGSTAFRNIKRANEQLGLPSSWDVLGDHPLFLSDNWPEPFKGDYHVAKTPRKRAKIACARLDHLVETGE